MVSIDGGDVGVLRKIKLSIIFRVQVDQKSSLKDKEMDRIRRVTSQRTGIVELIPGGVAFLVVFFFFAVFRFPKRNRRYLHCQLSAIRGKKRSVHNMAPFLVRIGHTYFWSTVNPLWDCWVVYNERAKFSLIERSCLRGHFISVHYRSDTQKYHLLSVILCIG